jgi:RNA exonuclease 1
LRDILHRWSGITAEKLAKATLSLRDVQAHFLKLLTPTTILLGHSLESDLNALKIRHPLCIDTALLYRHPRGQPYKPGLKWLVKQWLGREIQTAGAGGHDSEEDARACVDLLRMKLINGEF